MSEPAATTTVMSSAPVATTPAATTTPAAGATVPGATMLSDGKVFEADTSWKTGLSKELLDNPTIKNVNSISDLVKMSIHAQSLVGADKIVIPTDKTSPEEWTEIDRKLGIPEDIKKYKESVKLPEGISAKDNPNLDKFMDAAHKIGIRPSQMEKIIELNQSLASEQAKAQQAQLDSRSADGEKSLRQEWGQAFDKNIELAKVGMRSMYPAEAENMMKDPNIGSNPFWIKHFSKLGAGSKEDSMRGDRSASSPGALTPAEADRAIAKMMSDTKGPFFNKNAGDAHKQAVAEMERLYAMKHPQEA